MKGTIKVVGMLPGWPFAVKEDPTVADPRAGDNSVLRLLQKVLGK